MQKYKPSTTKALRNREIGCAAEKYRHVLIKDGAQTAIILRTATDINNSPKGSFNNSPTDKELGKNSFRASKENKEIACNINQILHIRYIQV